MTYPDSCVSSAINEYYVPLQINVDENTELVDRYRVLWTPNIHFMAPEGNVFYHIEGWLPPSEFSALLMVAHAHLFMEQKDFVKAESLFQTVWDKYPQSQFAPEALYYRGVARYKVSHDGGSLKEGWLTLQRFHPQSTWSIRSSVL